MRRSLRQRKRAIGPTADGSYWNAPGGFCEGVGGDGGPGVEAGGALKFDVLTEFGMDRELGRSDGQIWERGEIEEATAIGGGDPSKYPVAAGDRNAHGIGGDVVRPGGWEGNLDQGPFVAVEGVGIRIKAERQCGWGRLVVISEVRPGKVQANDVRPARGIGAERFAVVGVACAQVPTLIETV